ncbi:MAG: T9SS type A sorting domain-containing protein [Ignavibacteriales bacterium]|nr:T9SS type A sorting domain-containing protein [Ignavibacteriales bacterium]
MPFELWNIGIGTPNDPGDDYKLIPFIFDMNGNEVFDLDSVDHPISGGDNDPETDWIYWYNPVNKSPGTLGYDAWVASNFNDNLHVAEEVMARMVFVNFNAGSISDPTFPANVNQKLPESGSVFRILTTKTNQPGDRLIVHTTPLSVRESGGPLRYHLYQNYPNPFNPTTTISYELPVKGNVVLRIFDMLGREIRTLIRATEEPGMKTVRWDAKNNEGRPVATGVYFYRLDVSNGFGTSKRTVGIHKMLLIK